MGDWWIDESPPAGPRYIKTIGDFFAELAERDAPLLVVPRAYGKEEIGRLLSRIHQGVVISNETSSQLAFGITEALRPVESLMDSLNEFNRKMEKRAIGKGQVGHCGPRTSTTFGHRGRKNY
jgi:hypothetical protein